MEEIYLHLSAIFSLIALDKVYKYLDDDEAKRAEFKRYVMDCQKKKSTYNCDYGSDKYFVERQ